MPRWRSRITAFPLALLFAGVLSLTTLPGAAASAASRATNGAQASSTLRFHLRNEYGWCLHDNGHNNVMNTSAQPCATYFTLTFAGHIDGFDWYYMHINGGSECLNYVASIGGWVSDDSCVPGDTNEFWEHHFGNEWGNFTSGSALAACHDSNNAAIYASFSPPARCTINDLKLLNWPFYPF